ncbi:MAG: tetratricopeptide repeat protein [Deltaproteobacteria bacterium]|nr:tetratricopeptide repeat protein [Deltaproteobacteria bacterium]
MAEDKSTILDRAQKYLQRGYLDKAALEYKKVVERDPQDVTQRLRLGDLYVKLNKKEDAIKEYGEVAKIYSQKGFYLKAIAVYKQVLKLDETITDVHFKLAELYGKHRLIADAMAEYSFLVSFFEKKNKSDDVLDILKKMLEMDPNNIGTRLKLADIWHKRGHRKEAYEEYDRAVKKMIADRNIEKAEKVLSNLYESDPKETMVLEGLAFVYRQKGEDARFMQMFKEAAAVYNEKGLLDKRNDIYGKILEVFPEDKESQDALGAALGIAAAEVISTPPIVEAEAAIEAEIAVEEKPEISAPAAEVPLEEEIVIEFEEAKEEEKPLIEFPSVEAGTEPSAAKEIEAEAEEIKLVPEGLNRGEEAKPEEPLISIPEIIEEAAPAEEYKVVEEIPLIEEVEELREEEKPLEVVGVSEVAEEKKEEPEAISEATVEEIKPSGEEFVDLSKELGLEESLDFLTESWAPSEGKTGEETFTEFKKGVEKQLSQEDSETHYNLGIAYMEMGLYDDAIREFKIAIKDANLEFDCYARLGLNCIAKSEYSDAINYFLKGLKVHGHSQAERKGLMYELASAYEMSGDFHEALGVFKSVAEIDPGFRGVQHKIEELSMKKEDIYSIPKADDIIEIELF